MAGLGEFGAELAEVDGTEEPDTFTFHGHEFTLPDKVSALPSLRFAYNAQQVDAAQHRAQAAAQRARTDAQRQAAAMAMAEVEMTANAGLFQFLRDMLPGGQWERFEAVAAEVGADEMEMLGVAQKIMQAVAVRPTRRSSGSPAGPSPTGPTSTDGSGSPPEDSAAPSGLRALRRVVPVTEEGELVEMTPLESARAEIHATAVTVEELVRSGG